MKFKKILLVFLTVFISMFLCTKAEASARSSITAAGSTDYLEGSDYLPGNSTIRISIKRESGVSGYNIYCVDSESPWFNTGTRTFNYVGEMDSKIAYILANGYPAKSITGNERKDYFITSLAIYYVLNDEIAQGFTLDLENYANSKYWSSSSTVAEEMAKLVAGANSYVNSTGSISINAPSNKLTLTNDKMYYISQQLGVTTTGNVGNYTVSLSGAPSGTIVTDVNGNVKNTFTKNEKFLVKVPASGVVGLSIRVNVNVSANETRHAAYEYTAGPDLQNIVIGETVTRPLSASVSLNQTIPTRVEISKVDATNSNEIAGAHLVVKDSNGEVVDEWDSDGTTHIITDLIPGTYTLTETIAPEGYILSTETITFTVKADGVTIKKTMKNYPKDDVYISKQDATTGEELPGATLVLKDSKGKVVDEWISETTPHKVKVKLAAGKYTLTETIAPNGYKLSTETVEFMVEEDGSVKEPVIMKNYLKEDLYISKQDATTGKELPGAKLVLKDANGKVVDEWISGDEPHKVKVKLPAGKYTLTETIAPDGYYLETESIEFIVGEDGTTKEKVIMKNEKIVETGDFLIYFAWLVGFGAIGYSVYYFKNIKREENY